MMSGFCLVLIVKRLENGWGALLSSDLLWWGVTWDGWSQQKLAKNELNSSRPHFF